MRIGNVELKTNLLLAPIAGYCDLAFRLVVRRVPETLPGLGTVGLACTDLLCPQAVLSENEKSLWLAATCPEDQPLCMQLYGADGAIMAQAARWAQAHGATTIDINMGCPVDKVTKKNGGSRLLCDPRNAAEIAQQVVRAVTIPVSCKIRLGWDANSIITGSLPTMLADVGVAAITVHGRTAEQKFRGCADWSAIAAVVERMARHHPGVPVIGNGDVKTPADARRMLEVTGCAGVMIGRGALGEPWVFRDTVHYLATGELPAPLPRVERARLVLLHFENLVRFRGERIAVNAMRSRMSWYSAALQPWPGLRAAVQEIRSAVEFRDFFARGMEQMEMCHTS